MVDCQIIVQKLRLCSGCEMEAVQHVLYNKVRETPVVVRWLRQHSGGVEAEKSVSSPERVFRRPVTR